MKTVDQNLSLLTSSDNTYIDSLYDQFKEDPQSIDSSWKNFFDGFEYGSTQSGSTGSEDLEKEFKVYRLIQSYRARGHLIAQTNPIRERIDRHAMLKLSDYELSEKDLNEKFAIGQILGLKSASLKEIIDFLHDTYCHHLGVEYMHMLNSCERRWIRDYYEKNSSKIDLPIEKKKAILEKLNQAVVFENFLNTKYIGQKRFSLEGGETTIPALDAIIEKGAEEGAEEFIFAMAHRGRLNVLANTIGKTYEFIFDEFEKGGTRSKRGEDDVKYHLGYSSNQKTRSGHDVYLKIMHNPSHLEAVGVTANGYARAQTDILYKKDSSKVIPIVIHGDAAVAGQGIVYEAAQMSNLDAHSAGGSIHFVINNQIGFTTDFKDARSSHYCTSVAKVIDAPILHVNGDDPEAVVFACEMAVSYRQKFKRDIFIDMVCYRKHGHNEGDEPKYTQPHLYGLVAKHNNPRDLYIKHLESKNKTLADLASEMQQQFKQELSDRFNNLKQHHMPDLPQRPQREWMDLGWSEEKDFQNSPDTRVKKEILAKITNSISKTPKDFKTLKKAQRILDGRQKKFDTDEIDWALAEMLALGSILVEGSRIRFTGQDVIRGTFSHRHAKVFDENTNTPYCGLSNIQQKQAEIEIYNSLLSEYAVMGFEYGYSLASPRSLNVWEAQFGDFSNGAQIMIDQFISSGEMKWRRMSGLVLLLPHGYEGAGPEHSSARMERFLQMCAQENMVIADCTTPANFFHILRRQLKWSFRKPLVVFTPKSLLRHPACVSKIEDFTERSFQEVIVDKVTSPKKIKKLVICTGKIYYDLLKRKTEDKDDSVALVRLEQLYPFPQKQIEKVFKDFGKVEKIWIQEEPANMGAASFLKQYEIFNDVQLVSRKASASPATGFAVVHEKEQNELLDKIFKK